MVLIKCQQCGAGLHWDGEGYIVRCVYCGAEYLMHPRKEPRAGKRIDPYLGRGEVQGIPMAQGGDFSGMCPVKGFAPKGWKICSRQAPMQAYGDHMGNPFVVEAEFLAPDGSGKILYRGANLYTDRKLSNVPLLDQIDVLGSYLRIGSPFHAEQYCDYLLQRELTPVSAQRVKIEQANAKEIEVQRGLAEKFQRMGFSRSSSDWKRIHYAVADQNRRQRRVSVETRVNDCFKPPQQPFGGMGGFGGFGGVPGFMGQMFQREEHYWETQYELILITDEGHFSGYLSILDRIKESMSDTEDLAKIRKPILQYLQQLRNQTEANILQQNMAHWDNMSKIIRDTNEYTTNVMRETYRNTAATNDRVNNLRSESIRGVNTYYTQNTGYGEPRVVEASIQYDHVYQSLRNPNVFVATEEVWLEPGVDFEELKRTGGNY